jgi:hypothetical protein
LFVGLGHWGKTVTARFCLDGPLICHAAEFELAQRVDPS